MSRLRVLLAEDDLMLRGLIAQVLQAEGAEVHEVGSGDEALAALSEHHFDLVVTDVVMPSPLGVQVAAMARTAGAGVPILVITASREPALLGVVDKIDQASLLLKPFSTAQLRDAIHRLISTSPPRASA